MTEQYAIQGCKKYDKICQRFLFNAYSDNMLLLCMRYINNLHDAEDIMLSGFYNFYKNIGSFQYLGEGSVVAWLRKIMVNECLMFLRKKQNLILIDDNYPDVKSTDTDIISQLNAGEIFKLILQLPTGYRTVFNLFVIEGMSHREIALQLGITEGTSKSQLNKAKMELQKLLKKSGCYE